MMMTIIKMCLTAQISLNLFVCLSQFFPIGMLHLGHLDGTKSALMNASFFLVDQHWCVYV